MMPTIVPPETVPNSSAAAVSITRILILLFLHRLRWNIRILVTTGCAVLTVLPLAVTALPILAVRLLALAILTMALLADLALLAALVLLPTLILLASLALRVQVLTLLSAHPLGVRILAALTLPLLPALSIHPLAILVLLIRTLSISCLAVWRRLVRFAYHLLSTVTAAAWLTVNRLTLHLLRPLFAGSALFLSGFPHYKVGRCLFCFMFIRISTVTEFLIVIFFIIHIIDPLSFDD